VGDTAPAAATDGNRADGLARAERGDRRLQPLRLQGRAQASARPGARRLDGRAGATTAPTSKSASAGGRPGGLLANMLAAVQRARADDVCMSPTRSSAVPRSPAAASAPRPPTGGRRPFVARELALRRRHVLTAGQVAANACSLGQEPLAGARTLHQFGVPLVATLHLAGELLRRGADKALAWTDLCLAKSAHAGPG
jgi:DNA polymerase